MDSRHPVIRGRPALLVSRRPVTRGRPALRGRLGFSHLSTDRSRPLSIDGSRDLIEKGFHREAMFWIAVTYSRCQKVLAEDGSAELQRSFDPGFRRLLADLGITSFADLQARSKQVEAHLDRVWEVAEAIMAANLAIEE